jgi:ribosomal protein S18 acetylase RimI-like enzyme
MTKKGGTMRIIQTKDYETIARLNEDIHNVHVNLYPEYFKAYNYEAIKAFFKRIIHKANFTFLLIESRQQYMGYAWIELKEYSENEFMRSYKSLFVHQFSIIEEERNKGFGGKLMDKITEIAATNHIRKIELDYWFNNDIAKDFYNKNGYKKYREFVYKEL